nr:DNA-protecting protein DprA [Rikenellaceae bacterium]
MKLEAVALQMTPGLGLRGAVHLLEVFGDARRIFAASAEELVLRAELRPSVAEAIAGRKAFAAAERELQHCQRHGISILASTDADYPPLLREIPDYPPVLYVQGDVRALQGHLLAMVGTRTATPYGQEQCRRLVGGLAERIPNLVIVSGLAYGIDVAAHRAALEFGVRTVGVVANTLPGVTPTTHAHVAREMVEAGGAIVTELHSQSKQKGEFYLARNRLIAALVSGTIVVESPAGGGSLNTAAHADSYHRSVMAVPGRANDRNSFGTNHLIRTHKAQLVTSAEDVLEELMWDFSESPQHFAPPPVTEQLTADEAGLLGCFRTTDPLSMEQLHEVTGLSTGELTALLVGLELAGKVRLLPGNRYMKLCD